MCQNYSIPNIYFNKPYQLRNLCTVLQNRNNALSMDFSLQMVQQAQHRFY